MMKKARVCELCGGEAAVFCPSDAAFLCWKCDGNVHQANFLVARHVRHTLCSNCSSITEVISKPYSCPSCSPHDDYDHDPEDLDTLSDDSSSVCISSTTSPAAKDSSGGGSRGFDSRSQRRPSNSNTPTKDLSKAEAVFFGWCRKLGVEDDVDVRMACSALRLCLDRWTVLPFRVCLAASMWLGLRLCKNRSLLTRQVLKRLEEISGVPAKLVLAAESKLERALRAGREQRRRQLELEEGWAEC